MNPVTLTQLAAQIKHDFSLHGNLQPSPDEGNLFATVGGYELHVEAAPVRGTPVGRIKSAIRVTYKFRVHRSFSSKTSDLEALIADTEKSLETIRAFKALKDKYEGVEAIFEV
jgi:hypothetical protein